MCKGFSGFHFEASFLVWIILALERLFFSFPFPFFTKSMSVKTPLALCFATYTKFVPIRNLICVAVCTWHIVENCVPKSWTCVAARILQAHCLTIFHQTLGERDSLHLHTIEQYLTKNWTSVAICMLKIFELFSFNPMLKNSCRFI